MKNLTLEQKLQILKEEREDFKVSINECISDIKQYIENVQEWKDNSIIDAINEGRVIQDLVNEMNDYLEDLDGIEEQINKLEKQIEE